MNLQARRSFISMTLRRVKPGSGSVIQFLKTQTWNRPVTNLINSINVPFVIVGGVATRLYMPERMTDDLDILVHSSQAEQASASLLAAGASRLGSLSIGGESWTLLDGTVLDVLISDLPWVTPALLEPRFSPDGQPVINLPFLVLMKLGASRTTDLSDISRMLGLADDQSLSEVRLVVETYDAESLEDLESLIQLGKIEMSQD